MRRSATTLWLMLAACGSPPMMNGGDMSVTGDDGGMGGSDLVTGPAPDLLPTTNCDDTAIAADGMSDPFYARQWHLNNTTGGVDINLGTVWTATTRGANVLVTVVDDGLDIGHQDLAVNVRKNGGLNLWAGTSGFSTSATDPTPQFPIMGTSAPAHGTAVGGLIAARDLNGLGVRGVAPRACLAGVNLIATGGNTPVTEAMAMTHNLAAQGVSNNSWGATDGLGMADGTSMEWMDSIDKGVTMGRGGKGTLYLWAAGNGANTLVNTGFETDNSNLDGQANYRNVMAICGVMDDGKRVNYSEKGANVWVCGFSETTDYGNTNIGTTTTDISGDRGYNAETSQADDNDVTTTAAGPMSNYKNGHYTQGFNGTSSATPTVAGAVALVLAANPNLTARDARLVLAESARKNDGTDGDWKVNQGKQVKGTGGYHVNHKYGFGLVDAAAAVALAQGWTNLGPMATPFDSGVKTVNGAFNDNDMTGASDAIAVMGNSITQIEYIEVYLTADGDIGDLDVRLSGSAGTESHLGEPHDCYANAGDMAPKAMCGVTYSGWRFGSARHLGETANQTWTLHVSDRRTGKSNGGSFTSWRLVIHGR